MNLDIRTIILTTVVLTTLTGVGLFFVSKDYLGQLPGVARWAKAILLQALGWLVVSGLLGTLPDAISIVVGNGLILLSLAMCVVILAAYTHQKNYTYFVYAVVAAEVLWLTYFAWLSPNPWASNIAISLCTAAIGLAGAKTLLTRAKSPSFSQRFTGLLLAAFGGFMVVRACIFLMWHPDSLVPYAATTINSISYLVFACISILITYGYVFMCSDRYASQLSQAKSSLLDSEQFIRLIADNTAGMLGYWTRDLRCRFANAGYQIWFGFNPQQMEGMRMQDLLGGELFDKNEGYVLAVLRGENPQFERTLVRQDGVTRSMWSQYIAHYVDGEIVGFFVLISDVTELKIAQDALRNSELLNIELQRHTREMQLFSRLYETEAEFSESQKNLALVEDAAKFGAWTCELESQKIWASERWRSMFGFTSEEVLDMTQIMARIHPEDRYGVSVAFQEMLSGTGNYETEYRLLLSQGQIRWIGSTGKVEFDSLGHPTLIRGISLDITRRMETDLSLQQIRMEVAHLSRVSMLGELSGALAHELNQPLTAILSNAQAAQRFLGHEAVDLNELREILQDIVDEDKRAGEIIQSLRQLFDKGQKPLQNLDANKLVMEVVRILRNDLINHGFALQLELAEGPLPMSADRVQFQQVLINLIMNACDAMKAAAAVGQKIIIRTAMSSDHEILVVVVDHGVGIATATLDNIFEAFYTTKDYGMGLGLSLCRNIVNSNGGQIWGENNPDSGASFYFTIPLRPMMEAA